MGDSEVICISSDEEIVPPPKKKFKFIEQSTGQLQIKKKVNKRPTDNTAFRQISILQYLTNSNVPDERNSIPTHSVKHVQENSLFYKASDVLSQNSSVPASLLIEPNCEAQLEHCEPSSSTTIRRKEEIKTPSNAVIEVARDQPTTSASTVDEKKSGEILLLSRTLRKLRKRIAENEAAEVDWDDESNSKYMITERLKEQAWKMYMEICDLSGETVESLGKKRIRFNGTGYNEFNCKLETFVNETETFPDMYDVINVLKECNTQYNYSLSKGEIKTIATDAFVTIGNSLQKRRKRAFRETIDYFTRGKDPALENEDLKSKLDKSRIAYKKKMQETIDKFSRQERGFGASTTKAIALPLKPTSVTTTRTVVEIEMSLSDDVVVSESSGDSFSSESMRPIDSENKFLQIESVVSLHSSTNNFNEN